MECAKFFFHPQLLGSVVTVAPLLLLFGALHGQTDMIEVSFEVHDNVARRLAAPVIRMDIAGSSALRLSDDGSQPGDTAGDHIWLGSSEVRRVQRLSFTLEDDATGQSLGERAVFLPAADEARLVIRTTEGDPPMMLEGEGGATPTGDGAAPASLSSTSSGVEDGERFSYLLWIVLLCGLLGFGYLRVVARRIYNQEFLPTWKKLDRYLDRELERDGEAAPEDRSDG